ncbi:transposase family protein, partial [Arcanobacterium phocae]
MSKKPETIFTSSDLNVIVARLLSLKDVVPVAYHRHGPHQSIEIEQDLDSVLCPGCKVRARVKDRPRVPYIDLPVYGCPMGLIWRKHRWYCPSNDCAMGSWTSQ